MRGSLVGLVVLSMVSCQSETPITEAPPDTQSTMPTRTPVTTSEPKPSEPEPEVQKQDPTRNPSRIYQLSELETTVVTIGKHKLTAWVVDTDAKRAEGMMFLKENELKANSAMLFVFPDAQARSFWMQNTYVALDIAYIAANGKIVSAKQMKALDETGVPSDGPAKYVLEMKQGAFKRLGIKAGMQAIIDPKVKSK